jgi:hypothetical protein
MAIFNENDFDDFKNIKSTNIKMHDTFNITVTTVSPLLQLDITKNNGKDLL